MHLSCVCVPALLSFGGRGYENTQRPQGCCCLCLHRTFSPSEKKKAFSLCNNNGARTSSILNIGGARNGLNSSNRLDYTHMHTHAACLIKLLRLAAVAQSTYVLLVQDDDAPSLLASSIGPNPNILLLRSLTKCRVLLAEKEVGEASKKINAKRGVPKRRARTRARVKNPLERAASLSHTHVGARKRAKAFQLHKAQFCSSLATKALCTEQQTNEPYKLRPFWPGCCSCLRMSRLSESHDYWCFGPAFVVHPTRVCGCVCKSFFFSSSVRPALGAGKRRELLRCVGERSG